MNIIVSQMAMKEISKINEPNKSNIKEKISRLQEYPNITNIKRLINQPATHRLRVGDYRVLFSLDAEKEVIQVLRILHRKEAYR